MALDPAPAFALRRYLASARWAGVTFDDAWEAALSWAVGGIAKRERGQWRGVLAGLRATWQCAYERRASVAAFRLNVEPGRRLSGPAVEDRREAIWSIAEGDGRFRSVV